MDKTIYRKCLTTNAAYCPFTGRALHDIESWDVVLPSYLAKAPAEVHVDATRSHGYFRDGRQHVIFTRIIKHV